MLFTLPQEVGVHVISPVDALRATPLEGAVAAVALRDALPAADANRCLIAASCSLAINTRETARCTTDILNSSL